MNVLDFSLIIIGIYFLLWGVLKGFLRCFFSLIFLAITVCAAYFLTPFVSALFPQSNNFTYHLVLFLLLLIFFCWIFSFIKHFFHRFFIHTHSWLDRLLGLLLGALVAFFAGLFLLYLVQVIPIKGNKKSIEQSVVAQTWAKLLPQSWIESSQQYFNQDLDQFSAQISDNQDRQKYRQKYDQWYSQGMNSLKKSLSH